VAVWAEISIKRGVGRVENKVAVAAFAQMTLNLVFNGGREFAL
jgi:hypothetical protein